jgi:hypothetical protein
MSRVTLGAGAEGPVNAAGRPRAGKDVRSAGGATGSFLGGHGDLGADAGGRSTIGYVVGRAHRPGSAVPAATIAMVVIRSCWLG